MLQARCFAAEVQIKVPHVGEGADHQKALTGEHVTPVQVEGGERREACNHCRRQVAKHSTLRVLQHLLFVSRTNGVVADTTSQA